MPIAGTSCGAQNRHAVSLGSYQYLGHRPQAPGVGPEKGQRKQHSNRGKSGSWENCSSALCPHLLIFQLWPLGERFSPSGPQLTHL